MVLSFNIHQPIQLLKLLDKKRMLAITKCDMLDDELIEELRQEIAPKLPADLEVVFISSVTGKNIQQLKDKLWEMIN